VRVLHVNKFWYRRGGAEAYALDLANAQAVAGDEVAAFAMAHPDNELTPFADTFPDQVELDPVPPGWSDRVRATGRMLWSRSAGRGLTEVVARFRPDVAHLHNVYHQLSPSVVAALDGAGVPTVLTLHDYKLVCPSYQLLDHGTVCEACVTGGVHHALRRRCKDGSLASSGILALESGLHRHLRAYRGVDRFIAPSRFLAARVRMAGLYRDRLVVVPHGVEASNGPIDPDARARSRARWPAGAHRVMVAGRLAPEKGVDVAIDALGRLASASLLVVGDGPERSALQERAARVAPGRVAFSGRLAGGEVRAALAVADVVVVPSRWHENQPIVVLEAFAEGAAVVATTLGGLPELVEHDRTGLLVGPDDAEALAEAVSGLLADPVRRARVADAGRRRCEQDHDPSQHLDRLRVVYRDAAARRAGGAGPARATGRPVVVARRRRAAS
jgi:glycosyltransferase involved in cell wall biosynthesis